MDWAAAAIAFGIMLVPIVVFSVIYCMKESKRLTAVEAVDQARRDAQSDFERANAAIKKLEDSGENDVWKFAEPQKEAMDAALRLLDMMNPPVPQSQKNNDTPGTNLVRQGRLPGEVVVTEAKRVVVPQPIQDEAIYGLRARHASRVFNGPLMFIGGWVITGMGAIGCRANSASLGLNFGIAFVAVLAGFALIVTGHDWKNSPLRWYCPSCGKLIHAKMSWRCGYCDHVSNDSSFLDCCGNANCRTPPKSLECPHCDRLLFLDRDNDGQHPARRESAPLRPVPRMEDAVRNARDQEIEEREHERKKLSLDIELAQLRVRLDPPKPVVRDRRQERIDRIFNGIEDAVVDCKTLQQTIVAVA
jgi:hypothetical protein